MYATSRSALSQTALFSLVGVAVAPSIYADTLLTFDARPPGQGQNVAILQTFGDHAISSSPGVVVTGSGTPDIDLSWGGEGSGRWDFYTDSVWTAAQMNDGNIGQPFDITFTPTASSSAVIRSFDLHPYYTTGTTYEYSWSVLDAGSELASGTVTAVSDGTHTPVAIGYQGQQGQVLTLRLTRTGGDGQADSIAIDNLLFGQQPELPLNPLVAVLSPTAGDNKSPELSLSAVIKDGALKVAPASIALTLDGVAVTPSVKTPGVGQYEISYTAPKLGAPASPHQFSLVFSDTAVPANSYTNSVSFSVRDYVQITLPDPIITENFDSVEEGSLPAGWKSFAYIPGLDPTYNLQDLNSASFENWVVIESERFNHSFLSYTAHTQTSDYARVLTENPNYAVNGTIVKSFAVGKILFNTSGYRSGPGQYAEITTPDYDLTGKTGIELVFNSLWEQNQDSIAVTEYSIDQGVSWLPVAYFLKGTAIQYFDENTIDAVSTMTATHSDTPHYTDPDSGEDRGSTYGDFIKAPIDDTLAAYIQARVDDNPSESKRVEVFSVPAADNQPKVRFRFAHAGTDSWYWGIDQFGLYSVTSQTKLTIERVGTNYKISWVGSGTLEEASSLSGPWTDVPAASIVNNTYTVDAKAAGGTKYYRTH